MNTLSKIIQLLSLAIALLYFLKEPLIWFLNWIKLAKVAPLFQPRVELVVAAITSLILIMMIIHSLRMVNISKAGQIILLFGWLIIFSWYGWFSFYAPFRSRELVGIDLFDIAAVEKELNAQLAASVGVYVVIILLTVGLPSIELYRKWGRNRDSRAPG